MKGTPLSVISKSAHVEQAASLFRHPETNTKLNRLAACSTLLEEREDLLIVVTSIEPVRYFAG